MSVEQEAIWVDVVKPNLLTPAEVLEVRRAAKFWKVWRHEKKRSVTCRMYDKEGFIHSDERMCQQNLELDSIFDQQMIEAEAIGPELEER